MFLIGNVLVLYSKVNYFTLYLFPRSNTNLNNTLQNASTKVITNITENTESTTG